MLQNSSLHLISFYVAVGGFFSINWIVLSSLLHPSVVSFIFQSVFSFVSVAAQWCARAVIVWQAWFVGAAILVSFVLGVADAQFVCEFAISSVAVILLHTFTHCFSYSLHVSLPFLFFRVICFLV